MPKIVVSTDDGEVAEIIELTGHYDLDKPVARMALRIVVAEAIATAKAMEARAAQP